MQLDEELKREEESNDRRSIKNSKEGERGQTQFRLVLDREAIGALEKVVETVNEGFGGGQVTKTNIASYLFRNAHKYLKKTEIDKIRSEFFDEKVALQNLIRKSEQEGTLPEELRKLLRDRYRDVDETLSSEV